MPIYKTKGKKDGLKKYIVRINYLSNGGQPRQLSRVAYGIEKAKDMEIKLNNEIRVKGEKPVKKMTVQELYDEYIEVKRYELRESSLVQIKKTFHLYILPSYKCYRIDRIGVNTVQDWKISIEKRGLSLNTKKRAFKYFSALINYAVKMEYLNKNPFTKIGNFKDTLSIQTKMKYYTPEEFKRYIKCLRDIAEEKERLHKDLSEWNYYVFFNIAFYTGLRKGEIHALKWSDIDSGYLSVSRSIAQKLKGGDRETAPKNRSSMRTIQMPLPLIKILDEHKKRHKALHGFNDDFRICNGIRDTTIQKRNDFYAKRAELIRIRIHDFRHSHVSALANENINIQEVARRLGHKRIDITWNTYCHLYPREEERAVSVLNLFV